MLRFTPPQEEAKSLPRYASYVVGSGLKVHRRIVDAKNSWRHRAFAYQETGELVKNYAGILRPERKHLTKHSFILENVEGLWFTLYEIAPGLTNDELPWVKTFVKDTRYDWGSDTLLEDFNKSDYYVNLRKENPDRFTEYKKPMPMSLDEYVTWRLAVQAELYRNGQATLHPLDVRNNAAEDI